VYVKKQNFTRKHIKLKGKSFTLWTSRRLANQRPKKVSYQDVPFIARRVFIKPKQQQQQQKCILQEPK
jgi:hypothetical protein